jgi:hypothetical protein
VAFKCVLVSLPNTLLNNGITPGFAMEIIDTQRRNLLQVWQSQQVRIRAEFTAGNISVWFTGYVASYSPIELVLARDDDEVSISLFCGKYHVFEPDPTDSKGRWKGFQRAVVVTTDANTACTLYELSS